MLYNTNNLDIQEEREGESNMQMKRDMENQSQMFIS